MADNLEVEIEQHMETETPTDVHMEGSFPEGADQVANGDGKEENGEEEEAVPTRVTFTDYLKSPIVELVVGDDENATTLSAHQALLVRSPFFEQACAQFDDNGEVRVPSCPSSASF
jgi:hypothetical protein